MSLGMFFSTILNALFNPHAYRVSTIADPDDSIGLRTGILFLFDSSTNSHILPRSETTIGAQHSIALPIMSAASFAESAGSRFQ